ncbi:hypothetical protein [Rossellomorea marisflavi]|uniref:hypothetical protein n=1 Tax=Rossellomorea marisflavi TaxID=189381 RepID=UPI003F9F3AFB
MKELSVFFVGLTIFLMVLTFIPLKKGLPVPIENPVVNHWRQELERVGMNVETNVLDDIYASHLTKSKEFVPYEVFFSREDFRYLISQFYSFSTWDEWSDGYKDSGVKIDELESAIHVSKLLKYLETIQESKRLVVNLEPEDNWSKETKKKWKMLKKEEKEVRATINAIIYETELDEDSFLLSFSKESLLTEEERLNLVDEKLKKAKPVMVKGVGGLDESVTSPALVDIIAFLNQHELPEAVESELKETMEKIQEKLEIQSREKDEERLLLDASVLNKTAKDFHQIE